MRLHLAWLSALLVGSVWGCAHGEIADDLGAGRDGAPSAPADDGSPSDGAPDDASLGEGGAAGAGGSGADADDGAASDDAADVGARDATDAADALADVSTEAGGDASEAGLDAALDATTDASTDAALDAPIDASTDAALDATTDASTDAALDATSEAPVDAISEASADAISEASADASDDAECTSDDECPANQQCASGACVVCKSDAACGATCAPCGGDAPHCLDLGASSQCVQCRTTGDCTSGGTCSASHTCVAGCTMPAGACDDSTTKTGRGCANAIVIGRSSASAGSGYRESTLSTCVGGTNAFTEPGCASGGYDLAYKIWLRQGDAIATTIDYAGTPYTCSTSTVGGQPTFGIWQSQSGCADTTCTAMQTCKASVSKGYTSAFTAPSDGWYTLVFDSPLANDGSTIFDLTVKLTCVAAGCGCP